LPKQVHGAKLNLFWEKRKGRAGNEFHAAWRRKNGPVCWASLPKLVFSQKKHYTTHAMPNRQKHRGAHPSDAVLFSGNYLPALQAAVADVSWLKTRGYSEKSVLKLVGDRYQLKERQRKAVMRCACSDQQLEQRRQRQAPLESLRGSQLLLDGFNLLITIESALSGGYLFQGRDGCYRDIASIHGSYRQVEETLAAILLIGQALEALGVGQAKWLLDKPVSNSGRLSATLIELSKEQHWQWESELLFNPDQALIQADGIIVSSDGIVLEQAGQWADLPNYIVQRFLPQARVIGL
jgi:hypothetical protein